MEAERKRFQSNESSDEPQIYTPDHSELLLQLQEKIKSQAIRLRSLEQYKELCEARITEIIPGHPLPIEPDMLGTSSNPLSKQLEDANLKISLLQDQLSQFNARFRAESKKPDSQNENLEDLYVDLRHKFLDLSKEKALLEESLRAEILASEEQKVYIEVLKETLENHIEKLGLSGVGADAFTQYAKEKEQSDENRRRSAKMQHTLKDQEVRINKLAEGLEQKSALCKELEYVRDELKKQLSTATSALQYNDNEIHRLEAENSELSKNLEEATYKLNILTQDLENAQNSHTDLHEEHSKLKENLDQEKGHKEKFEKELESSRSEHARNERSLREVQQSFNNLRARIEEKENEITIIKEDLQRETVQKQSIERECEALNEKVNLTEGKLDETEKTLEQSRKREAQTSINLSQIQSQLNQAQISLTSLETENKELQKTLENKTFDYEELKIRNESNLKQIDELRFEIEKMWNEKQETYQRDQSQVKEINGLYARLNENQKNSEIMQNEIENLNNEILNLRDEIEKYKSSLLIASEKRDNYASELRSLESCLSQERTNHQYSQNENTSMKLQIEEITKDLAIQKHQLKEKDEHLKESEITINSFNDIVKRLREEIDGERNERRKITEAYDRLSSDFDKLKDEKNNLEIQIEECCKIGGDLVDNSKELNLTSVLAEFLASWDQLPAELNSVQRWMQLVIEEILQKFEKNLQLSRENEQAKSQINSLQRYIEEHNREENLLRSKEEMLKNSLDDLYSQNIQVKENLHTEIAALHREIIGLRSNIQNLHEDNEKLNDEIRKILQENQSIKSLSESKKESLERKISLIVKQKRDLEDMMTKFWRSKAIDSKRIFDEIMRIRAEAERCESEKWRLSEQLDQNVDLNTKDSIKRQIGKCDDQYLDFKKRLYSLENELIENEMKESRKKLIGDTRNYSLINESGDGMTRESLSRSAYFESPRNSYVGRNPRQ
ncbi:unnamed protein product [Blepharisma stoltei]|uniref:Uncharacterized protein n=1 Tax=Blepharisma stoltei TaxID=1481888 RepID=A0AAU9JET4_9CILI|nr:unnamed protein product [Blepharisma stoltei]